MGVRLSLILAPEFLGALLGLSEETIREGHILVDKYRGTPMSEDASEAFSAMVDHPAGKFLMDYMRPFYHNGEFIQGSLEIGKQGFSILWNALEGSAYDVDPICGSISRDELYFSTVWYALSRSVPYSWLDWDVVEKHCQGFSWG
jgi:hypothetical protein